MLLSGFLDSCGEGIWPRLGGFSYGGIEAVKDRFPPSFAATETVVDDPNAKRRTSSGSRFKISQIHTNPPGSPLEERNHCRAE